MPSQGVPGEVATRTGLHMHFLHRHSGYTVIIVEEGKSPHPCCPHCDMMVLLAALNGRQPNTDQCAKGVEKKRHRLAEEEVRASTEWSFWAYGFPLTSVSLFKHLECILMALYYD